MINISKSVTKTNIARRAEIFEEKSKTYFDIGVWSDSLDTVAQKEAVKNMIETWFNTVLDERFFRNDWGNDLIYFIHKDVNYFNANFDLSSWLDKLASDVQVIDINKEKSELIFTSNNSVKIIVFYTIKDTGIEDEITLTELINED